jgi:signal transduction histidine kinase
VLARSVTKPVRRLQVAAQRFSRGDLTPIGTGSNSAPELAALETGLNDKAQQLARTEQYREPCAVDLSQIVGDRGIDQVLDNLIDNAPRAAPNGTRLGLAIAQAIVNSSGGEFQLTDNTPIGLIGLIASSPHRLIASSPHRLIASIKLSIITSHRTPLSPKI